MAITRLGNMKSAKKGNKSQYLRNSIAYIMNPVKTEGYLTGTNCSAKDVDGIFREMLKTKTDFGKTDGRQGYHFVLSFKSRDPNVDKELALTIASEFCIRYLGDRYQYAYAVHTDHDHIHAHIVFNSVSVLDGLKYHYANGDWEKYVQPVTNDLCRKYGLETIDISENERSRRMKSGTESGMPYVEWKAEKGKAVSWRKIIRDELDGLLPDVRDLSGLVTALRGDGFEVKVGKYLSVKAPGGIQFIRTRSLGEAYDTQALIARCGIPRKAEKKTETRMPRIRHAKLSKYSRPYLSPWMKKMFYQAYQRKKMAGKQNFRLQKEAMKEFNEMKRNISFLIRNRITDYSGLVKAMDQKGDELKALLVKREGIRKSMRHMEGKFSLLSDFEKLEERDRLFREGHEEFRFEHEKCQELSSVIDVPAVRKTRDELKRNLAELNAAVRECRSDMKSAEAVKTASERLETREEEPCRTNVPEPEKEIRKE